MPSNLSDDAQKSCAILLARADVQARPGLKKALEDLLSGRKPKPRKKGEPIRSALPDGFNNNK
jgi:hypothetical protein